MAGLGTASLAGCPGSSNGDSGGDNSSDGTGDGSGGSSGPVTDTIRVGVDNTPAEFNASPWTPQDNTTGDRFLMELNGLSQVDAKDVSLSGTTVATPHKPDHEEVEVMTWIEDYSVEPPYDWYQNYDDRATFWNGDPYDAEALVTHNHITFLRTGNKFAEGMTFNEEATDQWTRHGWFDKGEVSGQTENPVSKPVLEDAASMLLFNPPMHPDYTEPYLEEFEAATTKEKTESIDGDLTSDTIPLERLVENGWGSGMYEIRSMDDVSSESVVLRLRDDDADATHPNAAHTNVQEVEMQWASEDRRQSLQNSGQIDISDGAITPQSSPGRESLPDHMQEITRFYSPTTGSQFLMNWQNPHLQNLWVRRAIVEAIDWKAVSANGWGEESARVLEHDTFLMDTGAESVFPEEFLDKLHTYSREQDLETATEYMQRAGYTKQGGQWTDPNGNDATIGVMGSSSNESYVTAGQTIKANLSDWGFAVNFRSPNFSTWSSNLNPEGNGLNFDTSLFWSDTATVFGKYHDRGAWWGEALFGGSPTADSVFELTEDDERDTQNKPVHVQLPNEVGSIEAPDEAGIDPDLQDGREVDMFEVVNKIRQPGYSDEERLELYKTCAQYYNFYLPDFVFNQSLEGTWGNVRDFDWPEQDAQTLDYGRNLSVTTGVIMSGLAQASTDTEFQSPE